MSTRLATTIGFAPGGERSAGDDLLSIFEPATGAEMRAKGSLYALAEVTTADPASSPHTRLVAAARDALAILQREYLHDLTGGVSISLLKAVAAANRRLYHDRSRLEIAGRARVGIVALVVHERQAHVARLGSPAAVLVRDRRLFELPPPGPDPSGSHAPGRAPRRVAASAGEALEIRPFAWQGPISATDRLAILTRGLGRAVGEPALKRALAGRRPGEAAEQLLAEAAAESAPPGGHRILAVGFAEVPITEPLRAFEPVYPAAPLAGLPDRSPVPLADAIGGALHGVARRMVDLRRGAGEAAARAGGTLLAFVPRRRPSYPRAIPRTDQIRDDRRRRVGATGLAAVAALVAAGVVVAGGPAASPTDAIPQAEVARESIATATTLLDHVAARVGGADLVDREPEEAAAALLEAVEALERSAGSGVPAEELGHLLGRAWAGLDRIHAVTRIATPQVVADLGGGFDDVDPVEMVTASDGSLWVLETGRGRVIRVDAATGESSVVLRAGQALPGGATPGDPWLIATAATDVVVVDRDRAAWRIDITERLPHRMALNGIGEVSAGSSLLTALQHRPPLEIFTLYLVDAATGQVLRWAPPPYIPVEFPERPEPFLAAPPELDPRLARDLRVDVNAWLLQAGTVMRVDFGTPRGQEEYALDPPPDAELRERLDYRLLEGATVGDREMLYVYDAANARIVAFRRGDGSFVRQWLAPSNGPTAEALDGVRGLSIASVADGPPVAYLLTPEGVTRLVLD